MLPAVHRDPEANDRNLNVFDYSLLDSLAMFFGHGWHLRALFHLMDMSPNWPYYLVYMLSASLWRKNLEHLDRKIKEISFNDIRRPSLDTNGLLHDHRQDLSIFQAEVQHTRDGMPPFVAQQFDEVAQEEAFKNLINLLPESAFRSLVDDSEKLSRFLMDSFQLLLSSVSVDQAARGTLLTRLAFLYVPLSFVTGIFGMNITEINGGTPRWWTLLVSLVVVIACTAAFFWVLKLYSKLVARLQSNVKPKIKTSMV